MAKRIFLLLVLLLFCQEPIWAQRAAAREDDRTARKQWEEDQRADEYATSLRRRDWLKDRLILELGMGTKFPAMGENWFGFGAGVEYITRWHFSGFVTAGFIPSHEDPVIPEFTLDAGIGWRAGIAYYMFPKSPIHLSVQASYGTVYYDHKAKPSDFDSLQPGNGGTRDLLKCMGYEFDIAISYLSDQWYFLQAIIGMYYIGNGLKDTGPDGDKDGRSGFGLQNPSWEWEDDRKKKLVNLVTEKSGSKSDYAIPPYGVVFGIGIGFAFDEFFPDDTEVRRRERESKAKQNDMRRPAASSRATTSSSRRPTSRTVEAEETTTTEEDE
jgi:hypothetical protein